MTIFLELKRRVNYILKDWVKFYTKEAIKTLKLITIGSTIVIAVVCIKYKPAYKVTISGETIGYIDNLERIERKIENYIKDTSGNIAFKEIESLPEYHLELIDRDKETRDKNIMLAIEERTTTTYKTYAVTSAGENKTVVESKEEAENIINEVKSDLKPEVDLQLGIVEVYSTELNVNSQEDATKALTELKIAKVNEYETKKAEEEKALAIEKARKAKLSLEQSIASTTKVAATGNLNGMALSIPVTGSISSRFGSRSSSRSSLHTGLDISTALGTGERPISAGTVTYAGYKGTYGNLVIIDHGNGVESYYAHCNALYVSQGQTVDTGTTIAAVGSTGNSTGPHLHLEIRIGGTPVNPQNYLY